MHVNFTHFICIKWYPFPQTTLIAKRYFSPSLISNIKYHLFIEFDDPVGWNDKIGMLAQRAQLINTFLWKAAVLRVVSRLAPRTADGNYFLHKIMKSMLPTLHNIPGHYNIKGNLCRIPKITENLSRLLLLL